jgi:peptide/nickel transport system ATP-binding protein
VSAATPLLAGDGLSLTYRNGVKALVDVGLEVNRGEIVGLVGESGSGKSSLANVILRLADPDDGELRFDGQDLLRLSRKQLRELRRRLQIVPQDPATSLNPRLTVARTVAFNLRAQGWGRDETRSRVDEVLELVGLPGGYAQRYPHELSGGQHQRVAIARALATRPDLVVCDEAVSALDKSVQAQILNLIAALQRDLGVAFLFISHDLTVVEHVSDRVMVMYLGHVVESGPAQDLLRDARHPYTQALLASVPRRNQPASPVVGDPPDPSNPPSGCPFRTRCPLVLPECAEYDMEPYVFGPAHRARCLRANELEVAAPAAAPAQAMPSRGSRM